MMLSRNAVKTAKSCAGQASLRRARTTASTSRSVARLAADAKQTPSRCGLPALALHLRQCRQYAIPPPQVVHNDLPSEKYHAYSDATMNRMLESLETLLDGIADPNYEVEYSSGVLTLKLGEKGTYVINKQPPNKQIWLSSPFSGPKRYDYSESADDWVYNRDNRTMSDLLDKELSTALGREINLRISGVSQLEA